MPRADLVAAYYYANRFDDAIAEVDRLEELGHGYSAMYRAGKNLVRIHRLRGDRDSVLVDAGLVEATTGGSPPSSFRRWIGLRLMLMARSNGGVRHVERAGWRVLRGEANHALDVLEQACAGPRDESRPFVEIDPALASLRDHPRFRAAVRCMRERVSPLESIGPS